MLWLLVVLKDAHDGVGEAEEVGEEVEEELVDRVLLEGASALKRWAKRECGESAAYLEEMYGLQEHRRLAA